MIPAFSVAFSVVGRAGHCKTYRDTGPTGSHQIELVIGFRVRVKLTDGIRVRAWRV